MSSASRSCPAVSRERNCATIWAPFSVRRRPGATVSVPLAWDEVTAKLDPRRFTMYTLEKRVAAADPWSDFNRRAQRLPD